MRRIFTASLLTVAIFNAEAQLSYEAGERCGMNQVQYEYSLSNPQYLRELEEFQEIIKQYAESPSSSRATVLTIPVVVHVIHLSTEAVGTGRNLTEARIQAQIDILNKDFMSLNSNFTSGTPSVFQSIRGTPEIQFCLASKDPSGNATTGVTRHVYANPASTNDIENTIKPATDWDSRKYFNIWTVAIPGTSQFGGTLGYAYLPTFGMVGSNKDGVVIDFRFFGASGYSGFSGAGKALTHEVGHYLGLNHIWGGTSSNHVCTDDDGISDTPLQSGPSADVSGFNCSSGNPPTSCSVQNMYCNYMDYLNNDACYSAFTVGQVNVMRKVVQGTSVSVDGINYVSRASLLTSQTTVCSTPSCNLAATATATNTTCGSNNGTATVTPTGGSSYGYLWSNGGAVANPSGLAAGNYTVTVTSGSCSATATASIASSNGITASASGTAVSTCGGTNGTAVVTPSGGSNYSYAWNNGRNTASINGLAAGTYRVTVTTATGCSATATYTVGTTNGIVANITGTNSTCGNNNGIASVSPTGGSNYSYLWSNGRATSSVGSLAPGTYTVTISSNGCSVTASHTVAASTAMTLTASSTPNSSTNANGTATAIPSGGAAPINYSWSNGRSGQTITGLTGGTYSVTATDQNGCSAIQTVVVTSTVGIDYNSNLASVEIYPNPAKNFLNIDVQCKANDDVTVELTNLNGQVVNSLQYENIQSKRVNMNLEQLPSGFYYVRVKTNNGQVVSKVIKQ
jgi:hypothetical protein